MANNYYRPLYTSFQQALEKFTSNSSNVQEVSFSGSIMLIYDLTDQFRIKAYVYLNNFLNPSGTVSIGLNNFSSQIAVSALKFYGSNNVQITSINESEIIINTDEQIAINGLIELQGY